MFLILLRFSAQKDRASAFMNAHKNWIDEGLRDGVFAFVGSLKPEGGGAILAHGEPTLAIQKRVARDPFVQHDIVRAEILEITPGRFDERLRFLAEPGPL